ncbi:unnamed protein product [Ectocarpus sp. 12 AP-2014]
MVCLITVALGFLAVPTIVWLVTYFVPLLLVAVLPPQNLKKKYGAKWALVTGGGSGIGKALVEELALQGLNVVIVSMDDKFLADTFALVSSKFPGQEFRKVGATFSPGVDYMDKIKAVTSDINVQCVFNNAGFIVTGFYESSAEGKQMANLECNATAAAKISHHFVGRMIREKQKGCVVFTSSVAAYCPTPFSAMYGATKAFLSNMAASLSVEVRCKGIDVLSVHPSPVASQFYSNLDHTIELMDKAKESAVPPNVLPREILKSIGRVVWRDIGGMAVGVRVGTKMLSYNFLATAFSMVGPYLPDYKKNDVGR